MGLASFPRKAAVGGGMTRALGTSRHLIYTCKVAHYLNALHFFSVLSLSPIRIRSGCLSIRLPGFLFLISISLSFSSFLFFSSALPSVSSVFSLLICHSFSLML